MLILKNKQNNKQRSNNLQVRNTNNTIYENIINKNYINKNTKIISNSERNEYNHIIYYPSSKEWFSSVYSYNKSYVKSLAGYDIILNKSLKSYANMLKDKVKRFFKRRRSNWERYSGNKLHISKAELKHTSTNLFITLHVYNKKKLSFEKFMKKIITLVRLKKITFIRKIVFPHNIIKKLFYFFINKFAMLKKWNMTYLKPINTLSEHRFLVTDFESMTFHEILLKKNIRLQDKLFSLINIIHFDKSKFNSLYLELKNLGLINTIEKLHNKKVETKLIELNSINTFHVRFLKRIFKLQDKLFRLINIIHFDRSKFNNLHMKLRNIGLISIMEKLYNKNVVIELIELKSIHLNSDVFSSAVALKLRDRKNNALRILRKAIIQMVRVPDLHTLITFDDNTEKINKNNIIKTIKQQVVSGVRFEASGRLTRRLTAMRAVFKYGYVGSLKSIRTSFNRIPSTILRGNAKANAQYTLINSKTRNGTFGLKGWISSHNIRLFLNKNFFILPLFISIFKLTHYISQSYVISDNHLSYLSFLFTTGIILIIIGFSSKDISTSIKDRLVLIKKNINTIIMIIPFAFILILIINGILTVAGINVFILTSYFTVFFYSYFCRIVAYKLILGSALSIYTKEFKINNFYFANFELIMIPVSALIYYYLFIPIGLSFIVLALTKSAGMFNEITKIFYSISSTLVMPQGLTSGIHNLLSKTPIIGRYINNFFYLNSNKSFSIESPFRKQYYSIIKKVISINPLVKINRFIPVSFPTIVNKDMVVSYEILDLKNSLNSFVLNNSQHIKDCISKYAFKYVNLTLNAKVKLEDQIVDIKVSFKNGRLLKYDYTSSSNLFKGYRDESNYRFNMLPNLGFNPPFSNINSNLIVYMNNDSAIYPSNFSVETDNMNNNSSLYPSNFSVETDNMNNNSSLYPSNFSVETDNMNNDSSIDPSNLNNNYFYEESSGLNNFSHGESSLLNNFSHGESSVLNNFSDGESSLLNNFSHGESSVFGMSMYNNSAIYPSNLNNNFSHGESSVFGMSMYNTESIMGIDNNINAGSLPWREEQFSKREDYYNTSLNHHEIRSLDNDIPIIDNDIPIIDNDIPNRNNNFSAKLTHDEIEVLLEEVNIIKNSLRNPQYYIKDKYTLMQAGMSLDESNNTILANDNQIHTLLSRLLNTNKECFYYNSYGNVNVSKTRLHTIINGLKCMLLPSDLLNKKLTDKEIKELIAYLKNSLSLFNGNKARSKILLNDLDIYLDNPNQMVLVGSNKKVHTLLSRLLNTNKECFSLNYKGDLKFNKTYVNKLIYYVEKFIIPNLVKT